MKSIIQNHVAVLSLFVLLASFGIVSVAFAEHSGAEEETESHATTAHDDETDHEDASVTVTPVLTVSPSTEHTAKIQQLIAAMKQLLVLLQHQLEQMEGESEAEDDETSEDHHE
jgi:hypothetical protein